LFYFVDLEKRVLNESEFKTIGWSFLSFKSEWAPWERDTGEMRRLGVLASVLFQFPRSKKVQKGIFLE